MGMVMAMVMGVAVMRAVGVSMVMAMVMGVAVMRAVGVSMVMVVMVTGVGAAPYQARSPWRH